MTFLEMFNLDKELKDEEIIKAYLISISMEQAALSKIINNQNKKIISYINKSEIADVRELIEMNESIKEVLDGVKEVELILNDKIKKISEIYKVKGEINVERLYKENMLPMKVNENTVNMQQNSYKNMNEQKCNYNMNNANNMNNKYKSYNKLSNMINNIMGNNSM